MAVSSVFQLCKRIVQLGDSQILFSPRLAQIPPECPHLDRVIVAFVPSTAFGI